MCSLLRAWVRALIGELKFHKLCGAAKKMYTFGEIILNFIYVYKYIQHSEKSQKLSAAAAAKSLQSCPTLCDPIDSSPLGSSVPGILQARTLEWVAISFSNA